MELDTSYHCSVSVHGASTGHSAIIHSAYITEQERRTLSGRSVTEYTTDHGRCLYSELVLPENAPEAWQDNPGEMWRSVHENEGHKNAQYYREWIVSIPNEFTEQDAVDLVGTYADDLVASGMCVEFAIHWDDGNHHAHLMAPLRELTPSGEWCKTKQKKVYDLDENGDRIPLLDPDTGEQKRDKKNRPVWKRKTVATTGWDDRSHIVEWRKDWAELVSAMYQNRLGLDVEQRHESYETLSKTDYPALAGVLPHVHESPRVRALEAKGIQTEVGNINRAVDAHNSGLLDRLLAIAREYQEKLRDARRRRDRQDILDLSEAPRTSAAPALFTTERKPAQVFPTDFREVRDEPPRKTHRRSSPGWDRGGR